ncbi:MAG: hypothetical protein KDC71_18670 [Acidobacteria bacterium]|nr:hypothetical protein [Acidobacteriota bacterium]
MFLICLFLFQDAIPNMDRLFRDADQNGFARVLAQGAEVEVDLRPILNDQGKLSASQTQLCFQKFFERYRVLEANQKAAQSDTNYGLLELVLDLRIQDNQTGSQMTVSAVFYFKARNQNRALTRWHFQDLR